MNISSVISIALFFPFLLTLLIFGIIYLRDGYKKDLGKSLVSFIATIAATIISLLLSKLLGWGSSKLITPALTRKISQLTEELGDAMSLASGFIEAAINVLMSFLFFSLFFTISLAVLKTLGKKINWSKLEKLNTGKAGTRIAGMSIRGIDAILVTIVLLLPLYGSIAIMAPPMASFIQVFEAFESTSFNQNSIPMEEFEDSLPSGDFESAPFEDDSDGNIIPNQLIPMSNSITASQLSGPSMEPVNSDEQEFSEIIGDVASHPVLIPYKYGPGSWIFSSLSSISMNGNTIDFTAAAQSIEKIFGFVEDYIAALENENHEEAADIMEELISYTRDEVIHQKWSYDLVMALVKELDSIVELYADEISSDGEIEEMYNQLRPLMDMTFEEYTLNAEGLLDFAGWFVENYSKYINTPPTAEEKEKFETEMYAEIGDLLNHSEQAISLKRIILQTQAQKMFDALPDKNDPAYSDYYNARKGLPNSGAEFVNKYMGEGTVPNAKRSAEAVTFLLLFDTSNALETAEGFVRHPLFGSQAVLEAMDKYLYINGFEEYMYEPLILTDDSDKIFQTLDKMLVCYENVPYDTPLDFQNTACSYLAKESGMSEAFYYALYDENGEVSTIMENESGELYLVPEVLAEGIDRNKPLTEKFIEKNNLKPFTDYTSGKLWEGSDITDSNPYSDDYHGGSVVVQVN